MKRIIICCISAQGTHEAPYVVNMATKPYNLTESNKINKVKQYKSESEFLALNCPRLSQVIHVLGEIFIIKNYSVYFLLFE